MKFTAHVVLTTGLQGDCVLFENEYVSMYTAMKRAVDKAMSDLPVSVYPSSWTFWRMKHPKTGEMIAVRALKGNTTVRDALGIRDE